MAQVTLTLEEYNQLKAETRALRDQLVVKDREIERLKHEDPANRISPLVHFARGALTVVRFAVANLPPATIRGWPTAALNVVANLLPALPDHSPDDNDLATELRAFARECDDYAIERTRKREEEINKGNVPEINKGNIPDNIEV